MSVANLAEGIALERHAGRLYHGSPYDFVDYHLRPGVRIIRGLGGTDTQEATYWLHDTVEDTETTLADLISWGVPLEVVGGVDILSKPPDQSHQEYMRRVAATPQVNGLKVVDSVVNLDATLELEPRMSTKDYDTCVRKYAGNIVFLEAPFFETNPNRSPAWSEFVIKQANRAKAILAEHSRRYGQVAMSLGTDLSKPAFAS